MRSINITPPPGNVRDLYHAHLIRASGPSRERRPGVQEADLSRAVRVGSATLTGSLNSRLPQ